MLAAGCLILATILTMTVRAASAASNDLEGSIYAAAQIHGVDPLPIIRVARCESQMGRQRVGDHGTSHGPFMLNERPTGLLRHFRWLGYTDPYDFEQSADYFARVLAGEFGWDRTNDYRFGVVRVNRWSCW